MRGSMRERRPGVWELRVYAGRDASGKVEHHHATFHGSKRAAGRTLVRMVAEVDKDRTATEAPGAKSDARLDALALCLYVALLVHALVERDLRRAMAADGTASRYSR